MVTSGDIEEIISKLSSDKPKTREDGIKLLNSWLEGERSIAFCKHLTIKTLELKPNEVANAETWPFLLKMLTDCIASEISGSKKRPPKLLFAKTLRVFVQRAEHVKSSGKPPLLLSVVKSLFNHIWDVIREAPSFQSEYGVILRCLLTVKDYCFHMRKRVYSGLVRQYMLSVKTSLSAKNNKVESQPKEEAFRCILTLHSLLENPPGDFPDNLQDDVSKGFVAIFSHIRDEGKISRKLIECINAFLLKDGPNLECHSIEIHSSMQEFMFRFWLTTHDRGLKDALILYARLQVKLTRSVAEGGPLIKQLLDVVCKELDQNSATGTSMSRGDTARDDKLGILTNSQCNLMELAASVFYRACVTTTKALQLVKRSKTENAAACLREGLMKGKWQWNATFCFLLHNYQSHIHKDLIAYWFEGICESFERILNDANTEHAYDGLLWVLRSLQELTAVSSLAIKEPGGGWHTIWNSLVHGLPIFSNVASVADASLVLLGNIISKDLFSVPTIPQDIWDLRLFKHMPSMSALYFIMWYFTRKGSQGDLRDVLLLRQNLLRAILGLLNFKEPCQLNERVILLLPAAIFSLCDGCVPFPHCLKLVSISSIYVDSSEVVEDKVKMGEDNDFLNELSECSIEILAGIGPVSSVEESHSDCHLNICLPRQIKQPLLAEVENFFLMALMNKETEKVHLSDLFFLGALICNFIYGSILTRLKEEKSSFVTKMCSHLVELLHYVVSVLDKNPIDLQTRECLGSNPSLDGTGLLFVAIRSFVCSPFLGICRKQNNADDITSRDIIQIMERLLRALVRPLEEGWGDLRTVHSEEFFSSVSCPQNSYPTDAAKSRIVDIDLDVSEDTKDMDVLAANGKDILSIPLSSVRWKFSDVISVIASFFSVIPDVTWEVMFNLARKESNSKLCNNILQILCKHFSLSSLPNLLELAIMIKSLTHTRISLKLCCADILTVICCLLKTLISSSILGRKEIADLSISRMGSEQNLECIAVSVREIAEADLLDWAGRVVLIDCICDFVVLDPCIGQGMIEGLLVMLQDTDFRVRLFLARRVGVLFQTWDGHDELFQDIYSNIGVKLVMQSRDKIVTASEVLASVSVSRPRMETIIVTLGHLAFHSEKIEAEVIFMVCVAAAMDPCQRELAYTILENLSRQLGYASRSKYLEEVMGLILFSWVSCSVNLAALVEVRDLFLPESEPKYFVKYCCPWLLSALILGGSSNNLKWIATVSGETLSGLVRCNFVPIFAICMAFHCSEKPGKENGALVLQSSILHIAEMSEIERDNLIKKHMVSIVSFILSLTSSYSNPGNPFFPKGAVELAIRTIVDGFLEMDCVPQNVGVIDKINIFRADRVFMFILEIHYEIAAAIHHRHMCRRFYGIEVLIDIIGHRAAVSSTSNYLFNLVGQFIGCQALRSQCCCILSKVLEAFKCNTSKDSKDSNIVLGEQLEFLVSKLVSFCIPSDTSGETSGMPTKQVVLLLSRLIVDSDPSLYEYIRELEPFPGFECFNGIRKFHEELQKTYSPREHFLKFMKRTSHLPQRLLLRSLQMLHKKLIQGEIIAREKYVEGSAGQFTCGPCEPEVVSSIWTLVSLCGSHDVHSIRELLADFISWVGIGDPHRVVFQLPGRSCEMGLFMPFSNKISFNDDIGMPEELLLAIIKLLKKYLLDESVKIIDMASRVLQGIFATENGQKALSLFGSYEKSLLAVHSKGIDAELVEKLLSHSEKTSTEVTSIKESSLWKTKGKTYEMWICHLVCSLIGYCNDIILRLCQDIVLVKAEVAELLFSYILANLARRKELNMELCKLISSQVEENVFTESNELTKSIQVMLNALNELRLCYVMERATSVTSLRQENIKHDRSSSYSSRSRSSSEKCRNAVDTSSDMIISTASWEKVFWLSIDYLLVAKLAIHCGSYFTAIMYVEHWCKEQFASLTLGSPDFSPLEKIPSFIEILISAVTQINEPDSLYGIVQSHKLASQIITYEHEGNWSNALEYYDLQVRSAARMQMDAFPSNFSLEQSHKTLRKSYKGLMRSLQQTGCTHILDLYCQGLTSQQGEVQHDSEFIELQYEAAWRTGNWDFSLLGDSLPSEGYLRNSHFNENLHSCLRALQEGNSSEFHMRLRDSKQDIVLSIHHASMESTEYIYSSILKLQILEHLGISWDLRWKPDEKKKIHQEDQKIFHKPHILTMDQLERLDMDWGFIMRQTQLHMNLLEPFIAFRRVLLQILGCKDCMILHLFQSASMLRKGTRFSLAAAALHEFKFLTAGDEQHSTSYMGCLGRLEEAKLLRAQGQHEMAINLARYILQHYQLHGEEANVYRLIGKWLAETRSSNSRVILDQYLKHAVERTKLNEATDMKYIVRQCQTHFHLAHYADALFRSYEERLSSNEWQSAMQLRKHKTKELETIKQLKCSRKGEKIDYSVRIQELQKQLAMDKEEAEKLQDDKDHFLTLALEGYRRCLVIADKYDVRVVFRLVSLWFSLSSRQNIIKSMLNVVKEVQSYKFIPLVYQIASRLGISKDRPGPCNFQSALVSLVKKMAIDHPYHTIFQLLALANGDRVKDKQRNRSSFVVDMDKKQAAEDLLLKLSSHHCSIIMQMKQMVEIYIKLAELETKKEDTNKKIQLPRDIRSLRQLELVPVVTATIPVDPNCQYHEGSFPHFKGLSDSVIVMNGINAPKVVECLGSDGQKYRQLAKSGNDDLRQDAVMEQFFGLVNTFLRNNRDTWKRRLGIRTYKVVPFTPSAGVVEWVDGTIPLGEYLIGSSRSGGAHGRYGMGDWSFIRCREYMENEKDKRKAFQNVCENFRPVMHHFFLERFLQPADWFEKRLSYSRSVAASSMVGFIVGLGDRHSMNILIDQTTAEVVHIDLGVAFEQGLMLKTPERVPFRLTRDIVDGMGVTGVEGVFRRCCEKTLCVMRSNKEALLTIIEVFIYDPLYKWALSPLKALQLQKETDDDLVANIEDSPDVCEGNKDAARALMRVKQKLDGYEEGEMKSVHGQVQQLIQNAIDPERLCCMFPGWGAWL